MTPSHRPTRREALGRIGAGALGLTLGGRLVHARRAQETDDLAARILTTPRDSLLNLVEAELRNGATWRTLHTACFQAGVRDIGPIAVGGELHAVLVVPSVHELASAGPASEALLPVIYNLDELTRQRPSSTQSPERSSAGSASRTA